MSKKKIIIGVCAVAMVAVGAFVAVPKIMGAVNTPQNREITLTPQTEPAVKTDISEYISASGTVNAAETNGIYIDATQKVSNVLVKLGDVVKVGDVLVEYDIDYSKKELENSLQTQEISLQSARLSLQGLTASKSETEVLQLENSVSSAEKSLLDAEKNLENIYKNIENYEKNLADAQKNLDDNKALFDLGAVSQTTLDSYQKTVDDLVKNIDDAKGTIQASEKTIANAQSSLKQAELNLKNSQTPLSDESSKLNYQKQLNEIAKAELTIQNAKDKISDLTEKSVSHVEGTIIQLNVEEGSIVNDQTSIMKIADLNKLIVNANVSEYDAPLLKLRQKVKISTDAIANSAYEGEVTYISPIANVTSSYSGSETTVAIEVTINNPDGILKPGYSVDMEILVTDASDITAVSLSAVQKDNEQNKYYVYTVDENNFIHKTYVEIGVTDDMMIEITSGIGEGQLIVTSPTSTMADNTSLEDYKTQVTMPNVNSFENRGNQGFMGAPSGGGTMIINEGGGGGQRIQSAGPSFNAEP